MRLRELWNNRLGLLISVAVALFVAIWSVYKISLFPPGAEPRRLETASASTRVLVDSPKSIVLDLAAQALDIEAFTNRALLVGNMIGSAPVRETIARRVGIPADRIEYSAPLTREWPRAIAQAGTERSTSDILKSPDQYRLSVRVNPTVPIVELSAQAPTAEAAAGLADGAVLGAQDYLRKLGSRESVPLSEQVRLEQLGRAEARVINGDVSIKVATLSFLFSFAASCFAVLLIARIRRGWDAHGAGVEPVAGRP